MNTYKLNQSLCDAFSIEYTQLDTTPPTVVNMTPEDYRKEDHPAYGYQHTTEYKANQGKRVSNSKWVNNDIEECLVINHSEYIDKGWKYGRFMSSEHRNKVAQSGTQNLFKARAGYKLAVKDLVASGKHPSQHQWKCPFCQKEGKGKMNFTKHHGINCKARIEQTHDNL